MYFKKFNNVVYGDNVITDISLRVKIADYIKNNVSYYNTYHVKNDETPEILAYNLYGSPYYHWVILMMNDMIHPHHDWIMIPKELDAWLITEYDNPNDIKHYIDSQGYIVPPATNGATPVSFRTYEEIKNEEKRKIKLLKPEYLNLVIEELESIINNG